MKAIVYCIINLLESNKIKMNLFISHYFYVISTIDMFNIRFGVVKSNCVQIDEVSTYMNKLLSKKYNYISKICCHRFLRIQK
jgi:hypothetical protein